MQDDNFFPLSFDQDLKTFLAFVEVAPVEINKLLTGQKKSAIGWKLSRDKT